MQTSGREDRNESWCRFGASLGQAESMELVIMYQSTEIEQLKRPELKGKMNEVIKSGRKGVALKLRLKEADFELLGGSISTTSTT